MKWEYLRLESFKDVKEAGDEGWELISVIPINRITSLNEYYLKRRKQEKTTESSETPPGASPESFVDFLMKDTKHPSKSLQ